MTDVFTKKQKNVALLCALALGVMSGVARAETNPAETGYLTDQRGIVARSGFGLCWHTGFGPAVPTPECDGTTEPTPIAAVAEPTPAVVAIKPVMEKVTLDADTLFDFDKAVLRPAGRATLDEFVGKLKGINLEVITAVGHADRFGSEAYNQRLSEQRAAAVKAYLVSRGIESDRIQTEGKGEMQPVTKSGECRGAKSTRVIACLQPDRRVNIEVIGSQPAK
ncbi:MAG TPA: OmpA family protein [Rugosibacter sp.]